MTARSQQDYRDLAALASDVARCAAGICADSCRLRRSVDPAASRAAGRTILVAATCPVWQQRVLSERLGRSGVPLDQPYAPTDLTCLTTPLVLSAPGRKPSYSPHELRRLTVSACAAGEARYVHCPSLWRHNALDFSEVWDDLSSAHFVALDAYDVGAVGEWVSAGFVSVLNYRARRRRPSVVRFVQPLGGWRNEAEAVGFAAWA